MVSVIKVLRIRDVMSIQLYTSYLYHSPPRLREYQRSRKQKEKKKEEPDDVKDRCETSSFGQEDCCSDERTAAVVTYTRLDHQESIMDRQRRGS